MGWSVFSFLISFVRVCGVECVFISNIICESVWDGEMILELDIISNIICESVWDGVHLHFLISFVRVCGMECIFISNIICESVWDGVHLHF